MTVTGLEPEEGEGCMHGICRSIISHDPNESILGHICGTNSSTAVIKCHCYRRGDLPSVGGILFTTAAAGSSHVGGIEAL